MLDAGGKLVGALSLDENIPMRISNTLAVGPRNRITEITFNQSSKMD
jgi:hypothetical protein